MTSNTQHAQRHPSVVLSSNNRAAKGHSGAVVAIQLLVQRIRLLAATPGAPAGLLRPGGARAEGTDVPHRSLTDEFRPPLLQHV